jgi:hypothetical protein
VRRVSLRAQSAWAPTRWTARASRLTEEDEQREADEDHHRWNHEREHEQRIGHASVLSQPSFTVKFRVTERTNGVAVPFSTSGA